MSGSPSAADAAAEQLQDENRRVNPGLGSDQDTDKRELETVQDQQDGAEDGRDREDGAELRSSASFKFAWKSSGSLVEPQNEPKDGDGDQQDPDVIEGSAVGGDDGASSTSDSSSDKDHVSEERSTSSSRPRRDSVEVEAEVEPKLKFDKLGGTLPTITESDLLSCIDAFGNTIAIGSHWGKLYVLNLDGTERRKFIAHAATINDVCVDEEEEAVATASDDGKVVVVSLHPQSFATQTFNVKRPVKTVALDPESRKGARQFCHAGLQGDVVFHERGWFVDKDITIHSGDGPVYAVRWRGPYIAWSDDTGVKIFNIRSNTKVSHIKRPSASPRADLFRANLCWSDDGKTLAIGWATAIQVVEVIEVTAPEGAANQRYLKGKVKWEHKLRSHVISGLVGYREYWVALVCKEPNLNAFLEAASDAEESATPASAVNTPVENRSRASSKASSKVSSAAGSRDASQEPLKEDVNQDAESKSSSPAAGPRRRKLQPSDPPEVHVLNPSTPQHLVTKDFLMVDGLERNKANDYRLCRWRTRNMAHNKNPLYFILSPKEVIVGRERDLNDHMRWLLDRARTEDALECSIAYQGKGVLDEQYAVTVVGQTFLDELIDEGDFEKAATNVRKVVNHDTQLWEKYIFKFKERKRLDALAYQIPASDNVAVLSVEVYQDVLMYFLDDDRVILVKLLKDWPTHLYRVVPILKAVERLPNITEDHELQQALGHLYNASANYCKALEAYTRLWDSEMVFKLVTKYSGLLTELVQSHALLWMEFNEHLVRNKVKTPSEVTLPELAAEKGKPTDQEHVLEIRRMTQGAAVQLLITEVDPSSHALTIVDQLRARPKYLHIYLDALFNRDMHQTADFHSLQIELYAEFDYPKLGDFLRASTSYRLDEAYKVCLERDLVPELVFVLGRMGDNKGALTVILERMSDIHYAIDFAKEQDDEELWQDLIDHSVDKPEFISALLANVGAHIDPIRLIRKIPEGLEIPQLKESLIKIMQDYNLQVKFE